MSPGLARGHSVLGISHAISVDGKHGLSLGQAGRVIDLTDPRLSSAFPQVQPAAQSTFIWKTKAPGHVMLLLMK